MKRLFTFCLAVIFLFTVVSYSIFADDDDLTSDQRRLFNRIKLNVEAQGQAFGTAGGNATTGVMVSGESWIKWTPYRGLTKISEGEFFRIAGYEEEGNAADRYHFTSRRTWLIGVIVTVVGGLGGALIGTSTDNFLFTAIGLVAMSGGAVAAVLGGIRMMKNLYPYVTAIDIAEEYNAFVLEGIKSGDIKSVENVD